MGIIKKDDTVGSKGHKRQYCLDCFQDSDAGGHLPAPPGEPGEENPGLFCELCGRLIVPQGPGGPRED